MTYVTAFSASAMAGIISYVQLVQYPLFRQLGAADEDTWFAYHADHERRTGWVVAPLMIAELGSATVVVLVGGHGALAVVGLGLAAATWAQTFALAVPLHRRLNVAFERPVVERLIAINWLRTATWTAHGIVALAVLSAS